MSDSYNKLLREKALNFHKQKPSGKIEVISSKKIETDQDLSLAYSPGVAFPCLEIVKNPLSVFDYTTRGNLVAVITNGTAVLGLGNIGPSAAKPVMEGKGVLFKHFAGIDVFDIELNVKNIEEFIQACRALEPSFGGINLEDISAPDCFEIEQRLEEELSIPVFHDDQHGTAIITASALINACLVIKKNLKDIQVVFSGAGAAAIACGRMIQSIGVLKKNIIMCDSKGVIYKGRKENMNPYKESFATQTQHRTLKEVIQGADVFIGLSQKNILTAEMVQTMSDTPIIFALANPDPEIHPDIAKKACPSAIIATGRVDFPNQVNNVLGFPSIFRAALDVRATHINEEMKLAAVYALAELAREDVPESVSLAYGGKNFHFGPQYILPKPFDPRVVRKVAPAVAQAAIKSGVARNPITNFDQYLLKLSALHGAKKIFFQQITQRVKTFKQQPTVIFPEGSSPRILKAINATIQDHLYKPVLLGSSSEIQDVIKKMRLKNLNDIEIQNPNDDPRLPAYIETFCKMKKGVSKESAQTLMSLPNYFGAMSVQLSHADGLITGATQNYVESIRPILKIIGCHPIKLASGMNIILVKDKIFIFADTTINIDPNAEQIAQIAEQALKLAQWIHMEPRIAFLSFSNFSAQQVSPQKMKHACDIFREWHPGILIDGEMQADTAVNPFIIKNLFPTSPLTNDGANILIFPNLDSSNIAYKLVQQLGSGEVIGPLLMGVQKPVDVVQRTGTVEDVTNTILFNLLKIQSYKETI